MPWMTSRWNGTAARTPGGPTKRLPRLSRWIFKSFSFLMLASNCSARQLIDDDALRRSSGDPFSLLCQWHLILQPRYSACDGLRACLAERRTPKVNRAVADSECTLGTSWKSNIPQHLIRQLRREASVREMTRAVSDSISIRISETCGR